MVSLFWFLEAKCCFFRAVICLKVISSGTFEAFQAWSGSLPMNAGRIIDSLGFRLLREFLVSGRDTFSNYRMC